MMMTNLTPSPPPLNQLDVRLRYIANLFDADKDNRLGPTEAILAMLSTARGIARMKLGSTPPLASLQNLVGDE